MADTGEAETWLDALTPDEDFWLWEFCQRGLTLEQAEVLACKPGVDRHSVREALIAAKAKQVDPDWVFASFS